MNIFQYWEGPQLPYIDLCLQSVRQQCYRDCTYHLVAPEKFDHYIPDGTLHPAWKSIRELGVKSDCVRAACLSRYGGAYIDADTVMLRSPAGIVDESKECSFMTWSTPPDRVIAGYIHCRKDSSVAKQWLANMNAKLAAGQTGWCELGEGCLTPAVRAVDSANLQHLPLKTFLPIEIDLHVPRFFTKDDWRGFVDGNTVAFGLNHSWMLSRKRDEMVRPLQEMRNSETLIHRLITHMADTVKPPKITVCCVTWRRPELLAKLITAFENQDYPNREMVILDDSGELQETSGDRWRIISSLERSPTLGAKRNRLAKLVTDLIPDTDAMVPWDDDDLVMPWALSAMAAGLKWADFVRPSQVLVPYRSSNESFLPVETWWRQDRTDKMFHPAWGYSVGAFRAAGGYPEDASLGEDLVLAKRMRAVGASEADPLEIVNPSTGAKFLPYYVFGPWKNEHFSYNIKDYQRWADVTDSKRVAVRPENIGVDLSAGKIRPEVMKRSVKKDWWEDEVQ